FLQLDEAHATHVALERFLDQLGNTMAGLARNQARWEAQQHLRNDASALQALSRAELERPAFADHDGTRRPPKSPGAPQPKEHGKSGRKKKFTPAQLEALKSMLFCLLEEFGDPASDNPHPEFRSKAAMIQMLQEKATAERPKDF